ncbi:hypothetical protein TRIUR3_32920 [Triticum urartu]|uniref:Uncharacterized protein n=1 Tax=Triticum urartu TaxID=4572 RepID=M7Z2P6_TRIUA|nr:hypothetical protein TRIUR3_32920 [Triticum urartu]
MERNLSSETNPLALRFPTSLEKPGIVPTKPSVPQPASKFAERSLCSLVYNPRYKSNWYEGEKNAATLCLAVLRLDPHQPLPCPPSLGASTDHPPTGADPDDPIVPETRRPHPSTSSSRRAPAPPKRRPTMDPSGQPPQRASRRRIRANNYSHPPPRLVASTTLPCSLGSGESQPPRSLCPLLLLKIDSEVTGACSLLTSPSSSSCEVPNRPATDACVVVYDVGVQHVEAGRRDAAVADLLQHLLFDPEITGDEHNQMRTCVRVACALLLTIVAVRVNRANYVPVESGCHVQRDLDVLAPSEHLIAVEPLAKRAVFGELEHHKLGLDDL